MHILRFVGLTRKKSRCRRVLHAPRPSTFGLRRDNSVEVSL